LHIDLSTAQVVSRLWYVPIAHTGGYNSPRNFTLWGSNSADAFNELTYGIDTGWTQLDTEVSELPPYVGDNPIEEHYIKIASSSAYRYYAFKFADIWTGNNMQLRRLALQVGMDTSMYSANVVPAMTSDTTPSGVVTISSQQDGSLPGWEVFDHGLSTGTGENGWHSANAGFPAWISYQFPAAHKIELYSFRSRFNANGAGGGTWAPRTWTLEGSNDGTNWTVVDTRTGQQSKSDEVRTYKVANPGMFSYYKVNVTDNVEQAAPAYYYVMFQEIEYMEKRFRLVSPMITSHND
jgi:hypothetical protein